MEIIKWAWLEPLYPVIFARQNRLRVGCLLPVWWLGMLAGGAEPAGDPAGAERLMARGEELWATGDHGEASKAFEAAIAIDPRNPARPLHYGGVLTGRGMDATEEGDVAGAAWAYAEAERQLVAAIRLGQSSPEHADLTSRAYRLLGEIASKVRQDEVKAAEFFAEAEHFSKDELLPAAEVAAAAEPLFGPVGTGSAEAMPRRKPTPAAKRAPTLVSLGVANSVQMAGKRLRLAAEVDRETSRVREYVPMGETVENWTSLFAQRQHRQSVTPEVYASSLAELVASEGRVLSAVKGPGDSASITFVVHAPKSQLSEVNAWRFLMRDGQLISFQYAERVRGADHLERSERLAKEKSTRWLRELQVRRPVGLGDAAARLAAAPGAEDEE